MNISTNITIQMQKVHRKSRKKSKIQYPMARYDLEALRIALNMTQKELAIYLNISQPYLSQIENGRNHVPEEKEAELKKLCKDGVELSHFLIDDPKNSGGRTIRRKVKVADQPMDDKMIKALLSYAGSRMKEDEIKNRLLDAYEETDKLRKKVYELLEENFRLRDLLRTNNIEY